MRYLKQTVRLAKFNFSKRQDSLAGSEAQLRRILIIIYNYLRGVIARKSTLVLNSNSLKPDCCNADFEIVFYRYNLRYFIKDEMFLTLFEPKWRTFTSTVKYSDVLFI